jgi:hypothetical protein
MTVMSELAPNGALVAGSLEKALERFNDSSDKTWGQIRTLRMKIVPASVSGFDALRTGGMPEELRS